MGPAGRPPAWVAPAAVALLGLVLGLSAAWRPLLTTDSLGYALVARSLAAGEGLRTPVVRLRDDASPRPDASGTVPFTAQPPGLPLAWFLLGGVEPGAAGAVTVTNALAHALAALAAFVLGLRLAGAVAGLAAGVGTAVSMPGLWHASLALSEAPFTAAFTACLAALVLARGERPRPWLAVAGLAAAAACSLRYAGGALLVPLAWEAARTWRPSELRARLERAALTGLPVLLTLGALAARNLALSGHARGYVQPPDARPVPEALGLLLGMTCEQVGIGAVELAAPLLLLVVAPPALVLFRRRRAEPDAAPALGAGAGAALAGFLGYWFLLGVALADEPRVEARYAAPLAPVSLALAAALVVAAYRTLSDRAGRTAATALALGLLLTPVTVFGIGALRTVLARPPRGLEKVADAPTLRWLREELPAGAVVVTNAPEVVATFAPLTCVDPPNRAWNPRDPVPHRMRDWLAGLREETGARHVVVLSNEEGLHPLAWGGFLTLMSRREEVGGWERVHASREGVVYRAR